MQSKAKSVGEYFDELPEERRPALVRLRTLCQKVLKGYDEEMEYGMPAYKRSGRLELAFASQKNTINVYVMKQDVLEKHRGRLTGLSVGKGCIRYPKPERMDFEVIADLLRDTVASSRGPC